MVEKLIFGSQALLFVVLVLLVAALLLIVQSYFRVSGERSTRIIAPLFKCLAVLAILLCLLEPLKSGQRVRPGANLFLLLADNSQSLTIKDPGASQTRGTQLRSLLNDENQSWQVRLGQDFEVRRYQFDSRLQNVNDFEGLVFDKAQTNLNGVLNSLKDRFRNRPVAGVLLFTDGIATDAKQNEFHADGLPPIYPVIVGADAKSQEVADLSLSRLSVTSTAFEDAPVTIQADVQQTALPKAKVTAQVLDESGTIVKQETQSFGANGAALPFRFQIRPTKPGVSFYEVRVRTEAEAARLEQNRGEAGSKTRVDYSQPITDPDSVESTLSNNRRLVAIDRGSEKYRVLYLSGRPNWEFKFLRRSVESDEQVQITGIIRIAKKEPKFDWRSRDGEVSNPLFRGFDGKTEETERYDQPVLIRLNTKDPNELREGFPKTAEELYQYHAVIIDDLEADFFSGDQLSLLERFVSERGGGLLMLGGSESFRQGGYEKTPIGRMLPVYLDSASTKEPSNGFRMSLTRDGWLQPWARLRSTETEEQQRLAEMPSFLTLNRVGQPKPGASLIAEAGDASGQKRPALAVQAFGRGRCVAMLFGDLWRWQINRTDSQREKDDLGKAWRQSIRWLIADVPDRIEAKTSLKEDLSQPLMQIDARVRTKEFQSQDNAVANVKVALPDGSIVNQIAEPSLREAGLYESTFSTRQAGCYRATIEVVDGDGQSVGVAETGWTSDPAADEFAQVSPNVAFLMEVARKTSGQVVPMRDLDAFVRSLPTRKAPMTEGYTTPLWHQSWVFLLVVFCLCVEWGLRRWKGLP